jgi:predicted nucleic acid-binding protein
MRVFLDANVLFSAAKSDGAIHELLGILVASGHRLVADAYVLEEARRSLERKGPAALSELDELVADLELAAFRPPGRLPAAAGALPGKDVPVLAAAIRSRCDVLVTGDRTHFGPLFGRSISGVTVYSPRMLVEALRR